MTSAQHSENPDAWEQVSGTFAEQTRTWAAEQPDAVEAIGDVDAELGTDNTEPQSQEI